METDKTPNSEGVPKPYAKYIPVTERVKLIQRLISFEGIDFEF